VAAPWSVELNQNILGLVIDNGVEVLGNKNLEGVREKVVVVNGD
jgi:hypothetical protein